VFCSATVCPGGTATPPFAYRHGDPPQLPGTNMLPRGAYKLANGETSKETWALVAGRRLSMAPSVIRRGWPERNGVVIGDLFAMPVLKARVCATATGQPSACRMAQIWCRAK